MKTVILCGGLGTRLREETEYRPKPMVNIGEKPILWHIMKTYAHYGFKEFILPLGYKGEMIKDYFCNYELMNSDITVELGKPKSTFLQNCHEEAGWKITMSNTGEKTLKGGRLKRVEKYIDDEIFMFTYGDGLCDVDLKKLLEFHKSHGRMVTLTGVNPSAKFGELEIRGEEVVSFREKPKGANGHYVNGGFFVVNKHIFDFLTEDESCDLEFGPLEEIARQGELMVYKHDGFWFCMDTIRDVDILNAMWAKGDTPWKVW